MGAGGGPLRVEVDGETSRAFPFLDRGRDSLFESSCGGGPCRFEAIFPVGESNNLSRVELLGVGACRASLGVEVDGAEETSSIFPFLDGGRQSAFESSCGGDRCRFEAIFPVSESDIL